MGLSGTAKNQNKDWSEEEDQILIVYRGEGRACKEIASLMGRSHNAVVNRSHGLGMRSSPSKLRVLGIDYIKNKIKVDGMILKELSAELGMFSATLSEFMKRHNYDYKKDYNEEQIKRSKRRKNPGVRGFNSLLNVYKRSAAKRELEFKLSEDEFKELTTKNCYYCNQEPNQKRCASSDNWSTFKYNGIDRVDNNKGYVKDNCVPCCKMCNRMKLDLSYETFMKQMKKIIKFRMETTQ